MTLLHTVIRSLAILLFGVCAATAAPTFQITQVFSNIDGSLQFVELTETAGLNNQNGFAGLTLTVTHGAVVKELTFTHDLPTTQTAYLSFIVAASAYGKLPVTSDGGYNCCYEPEFSMPLRFLPADGGTVDFAGVDQVTFSSLPTDGVTSIDRFGNRQPATVPRNGRCLMALSCMTPRYAVAQAYTFAIEYYNAALDHYFLSASAPDIDALDSGRTPGWQRTGATYYVGGAPNAYAGLAQKVCRYYIPPEFGNSHFLSASEDECRQVGERFPSFILETDAAFYVALPDLATGECPPDLDINGLSFLLPMYRLWNQRADSNHRYTTSPAIKAEMVAKGWVAEGYGPDAVAFCVP